MLLVIIVWTCLKWTFIYPAQRGHNVRHQFAVMDIGQKERKSNQPVKYRVCGCYGNLPLSRTGEGYKCLILVIFLGLLYFCDFWDFSEICVAVISSVYMRPNTATWVETRGNFKRNVIGSCRSPLTNRINGLRKRKYRMPLRILKKTSKPYLACGGYLFLSNELAYIKNTFIKPKKYEPAVT